MNKIQINVPEGFEIDQNKSDLSKGVIEFKPVEKKKLSYEDIAKELFTKNKKAYYISSQGDIGCYGITSGETSHLNNNATSIKQLECLMAYNKLRNVAEYLNGGWKPDWNSSEHKYNICYITSRPENQLEIAETLRVQNSSVYFNSIESAKQAIEILGEEEIKKALFMY